MNIINAERGTVAGGISVVMIFLTLCIAIYCLLSFLTAENELSLNKKNRDAVVAYYAADAKATKIISELATAIVEDTVSELVNSESFLEYNYETATAVLTVPIDTYRNMDVSVSFIAAGGNMVITRYRVISSFDWQEQRNLKITVVS